MRKKALLCRVIVLSIIMVMSLSLFGSGKKSQPSEEMQLTKVKVGMSNFQDVNSFYVAVEQGFFKEEGIELEFITTDWAGANELLVADKVDIATSCTYHVLLQNAVGQDTTLAFPLYQFAGTGIMYDPERHPDWKDFDILLEESKGDKSKAMNMLLTQMLEDDAIMGLTLAGQGAVFRQMCGIGGVDYEAFEKIDMSEEDLLPTLLSGSIDTMLSGIPQRLASMREGYVTLVDSGDFPQTIFHCGFAAKREWIDNHFDLAIRIQKVIYKTVKYIEDNPDDGLSTISQKLKEGGADVSIEELKGVWNTMEFFINSKEQYEEWVVDPEGRFYWRASTEIMENQLIEDGTLEEGQIENLEDILYGIKIVAGLE